MNEMQNITKPLLQENKNLQEELTKEKQTIEVMVKERNQMLMYQMLVKLNDHKDNTQKIQNILDSKIDNFIQGQDDVTKQCIEQLRLENREIKRNCDIWKAKYKKVQREMHEVQDQFEEYSKVMVTLKSIQSKMQDTSNSSLCCSHSHPSSVNQSIQHKQNITRGEDAKQSSSSPTIPIAKTSSKNISPYLSSNNAQEQTQSQRQHDKPYIQQQQEQLQYLESESHHLQPDAANSLLDTLEGYDLFEQQLKEEIIQDINRIQHNINSVQSHEKSFQQNNSSIATTNFPSDYGLKQTNRSIDICITTNNNNGSSNSQQNNKMNLQNNNSPSPHFQQNPILTISVDKGVYSANSSSSHSQFNRKPPQYKDAIHLHGKYQQINQISSTKKEPTNQFQSFNTPSMKKPIINDKEYDMSDKEEDSIKHNKSNSSQIIYEQNNNNFQMNDHSQKSSPERSRNQFNSCFTSQEANASIQQESMRGNKFHGYSNQANCSTSTQQQSTFAQDGGSRNKRIKSLENRELRLMCQPEQEIGFVQEEIPPQHTLIDQQKQMSIKNNYIKEERYQDDNDDIYSDLSLNNQESVIETQQNNQIDLNKKLSLANQFLQVKPTFFQKGGNLNLKRNADEFSFKNPSLTEHEELIDQISSEKSSSVQQMPQKNYNSKVQRQNQQSGFDSDNQGNQRNDSVNITKNSCVSSLNNMVCIESIQLDQDNAEILKQMKDLDKKIEKEKYTYEKYLQKCSNYSSDNEKSMELQNISQRNQSTHQTNNHLTTNNQDLTSMLTIFDAQFENLQREKQKIINNFKIREDQRKTSSPPRQKSQQKQQNNTDIGSKAESNIKLKESLNIHTPPPSISQKQTNIFHSEATSADCENDFSQNNSEIDELRKRYKQTVQNMLGSERGGNGGKSKYPSNITTTTNLP